MDAKILEEIIDLNAVEYRLETVGEKTYKIITNINNLVLWDAIFFKIIKRLHYVGINIPQNRIEACSQEYTTLPMRINVHSNIIELPHSMQEMFKLFEVYRTMAFPNMFRQIALAGIGLWAFTRVVELIQEWHSPQPTERKL